MEKFTSEVLPSGLTVKACANGFLVLQEGDVLYLTKSDINRPHGIAFPEKRRPGRCVNTELTASEILGIDTDELGDYNTQD